MKIVVIGDALVASETLKKAVLQMEFSEPITEIVSFEWFSDLTKDQFQEKIQLIEQNGPEGFELPKGLLTAMETTDYLFAHYAPISKIMIETGKQLKLVGTCRGGLENVNLEAMRYQNIKLLHVIRNAEPVAEFTIGLMLAETRNIVRANHAILNGEWRKDFVNNPFKTTLKNQVVGIVGAGYIGKLVINKLNGLGVKVLVHDPFVKQEKLSSEGLKCKSVSLDELCSESDIISLHMRVSEETTNLINEERFSLMKSNAYVINTARAEILSENALVKALQNRTIAGAALDVVWKEPILESDPLLQLDNLTLTTHIAGDTFDAIPGAPYLLKDVFNDYFHRGFSDMLVK